MLRSVLPLFVLLQLPPMWLYLHFLRPMGTAMGSSHEGVAADAACALLFRIFSQPPLLFPGQPSGANQNGGPCPTEKEKVLHPVSNPVQYCRRAQ